MEDTLNVLTKTLAKKALFYFLPDISAYNQEKSLTQVKKCEKANSSSKGN